MLGGTIEPEAGARPPRASPSVTSPAVDLEEGPDDETSSYRAPLPPSDRLWRHPSEVGGEVGSGVGEPTAVSAEATSGLRDARASRPWVVTLVASGVGACVAVGVMAVFGLLDHKVIERLVVEREAVTPAAATVSLPSGSLTAVVASAEPAVARIEVGGLVGSASGSGVLFRDDGYLITNAHVVSDASVISVVLTDGSRHDATLVGADTDSDIAVVKIDGNGYPTVLFGQAATLQVGQQAIAIGSPLGLDGGPTATVGIISALNRTVQTHGGNEALTGMIQTDASIAPGSSGGGLFDTNGALVGITTAVAITESGTEGLGFAIPVEQARKIAEQLVTDGKIARVWLGVRGADMTTSAEQDHGTEGGAMLREVIAGGPAATAGLQSGDVITKIGDVNVTTMSGLVVALGDHKPGDTVAVTYVRNGQPTTVNVVLSQKP
jgi:putative serine protease PepD